MENTLIPENIFDTSRFEDNGEEQFHTLFESESVKLEQIVSFGRITAQNEWYDQPWDEWVMVVKGSASICIEGQDEIELSAGDYLLLKKHVRHRVTYTSADCIWLALHLKKDKYTCAGH